MARKLHVRPYHYRPGEGVEIIEGTTVVARVLGTSYPTGTACQEDRDLAAVLAAGPQLLAALKGLLPLVPAEGLRPASDPDWQKIKAARAAIEQAEA